MFNKCYQLMQLSKTKYKEYTINSGSKNQFPMDKKILDGMYTRFNYMFEKTNRCYIIRFDLHFPDDKEDLAIATARSKLVSRFFNELIQKHYKRKLGHKHIQYFWVREVEEKDKGHYHCWIMFDHRKINRVGTTEKGFMGKAIKLWKSLATGGYLRIADGAKSGIKVTSDYASKDNAYYAISYLAKSRGKNIRYGTKVRNFGGSKVPIIN